MAILSFLIILKYEKYMGSFKLIRSSSMRNLRGGETAHVITLIVNLLAKIAEGELEEPVEEDRPQVQMVDFNDGVEVLHVSAELVGKLRAVYALLRSATLQSNASNLSPEMANIDSERCRAANFFVRKILDYKKNPFEEERKAALKMNAEIKPYKNFYRRPIDERTEVINGLLEDARKTEYSAYITTMGLESCLLEIEKWNNQYAKLEQQRNAFFTARQNAAKVADLQDEAQDLMDDLCDTVNAAAVLFPSEEATNFIKNAVFIFKKARSLRNKRGPRKKTDKTPSTDAGNTSKPSNPDDSQKPDDSGSETTQPDDRPVVQ